MGRNAAATYEQVAAEAELLKAEGVTASAKLIRSRLGNVGSLSTIQTHVMEWRSKQGGPQPATRLLPPEVQSAVFKYLDEEVSRINGDLTKKLEQAQRDIADLADDNKNKTELADQRKAELAIQVALNNTQAGELAALRDQLKTAREETLLARQDLVKLKSRVEAEASLESQLSKLCADFETERDARVRAEQNAAVLKAQKDSLEERIAELKESASTQLHVYGAGVEVQSGKQPERFLRASTRQGKKTEDPGEPSTSAIEDASGAAVADAVVTADPRQGKLC